MQGNRRQHRGSNHVDVDALRSLLDYLHVNETFTA